MNSANTYWAGEGKYEAAYRKLQALVPAQGPVRDAKGANKHLDRLRRATNVYYDLFNNGLANRRSEFRALFGFSLKELRRYGRIDFDLVISDGRIEAKIDQLILAAAKEQGVVAVWDTVTS